VEEFMNEEEQLITIDRERCIGCFECVEICPQTEKSDFPVFEKGEDGFPRVINQDSCVGCLSCEVYCRAMAITVEVEEEKKRSIPEGGRAEIKCRGIF
jgi:NAD-dependent dihydropyrimidine dehydrogenase PreA subunit